jgi:hypothetical protein
VPLITYIYLETSFFASSASKINAVHSAVKVPLKFSLFRSPNSLALDYNGRFNFLLFISSLFSSSRADKVCDFVRSKNRIYCYIELRIISIYDIGFHLPWKGQRYYDRIHALYTVHVVQCSGYHLHSFHSSPYNATVRKDADVIWMGFSLCISFFIRRIGKMSGHGRGDGLVDFWLAIMFSVANSILLILNGKLVRDNNCSFLPGLRKQKIND